MSKKNSLERVRLSCYCGTFDMFELNSPFLMMDVVFSTGTPIIIYDNILNG